MTPSTTQHRRGHPRIGVVLGLLAACNDATGPIEPPVGRWTDYGALPLTTTASVVLMTTDMLLVGPDRGIMRRALAGDGSAMRVLRRSTATAD